ncbi:MAG: galactose oxidase [Bacteroidota bacterium]
MKKSHLVFALILGLCSCKTKTEELIGNWREKPGGFSGAPRSGAVAFTIGNKAYIGTGYNSGSLRLKTFYEYNAENDSWTQKADFAGQTRNQAVGFSIGSKGYLGTGQNEDSQILRDFWEYDSAENRWVRKADLGENMGIKRPLARKNAVGFAIEGKGYIGTGLGQDTDDTTAITNRGDMWEFNPADVSNGFDVNNAPMGAWVQKSDFAGSKRNSAVVFVIGAKAYVGTGTTNNSSPIDLYEFDPATSTGKWTRQNDLPSGTTGKVGAVAFAINGKGYLTGGSSKDCWEFDPAGATKGVWLQKHDFEGNARSSAVGFAIGEKGYFGTGVGPYDDFWSFEPTATYVAPTDDIW